MLTGPGKMRYDVAPAVPDWDKTVLSCLESKRRTTVS